MTLFACSTNMSGVIRRDVFAGLGVDLVDECVQFVDSHTGLAPVEGGLGPIQFGHQTLGDTLVVDMSHVAGVHDTVVQRIDRFTVVIASHITGSERGRGQQ